MPLYDDYDEWKSAMRVQIMANIIAQMSIEHRDNGRQPWPSGEQMEGIKYCAAVVAENWEEVTTK